MSEYFNRKWAYYDRLRNGGNLPIWLPQQGLLYYDSFAEFNEYAPTGQHYIIDTRNSSTAQFSIETFDGKKCLYKDKVDKQLRFSQICDGVFTAGIWIYDNLQKSSNQQSFNLQNPNVISYMINNRSSTTYYIAVYDYTSSSAKSTIYGGVSEKQKWNLLVARKYETSWELWLNNELKGQKTNTAAAFTRCLIHYYQNYGTGVREAFLYNRTLTEDEMTSIYNNTK